MKQFRDGHVYEFCFVSIDICGHSEILLSNPPDLVQLSLDEFEEYVESSVVKYGGSIWAWQGDGGLCGFYGERSARQAVLSALEILGGLRVFNLDRDRKPIEDEISVRIAIHKGTAKYREEIGRIHSAAVNLTAHLQRRFAETNSIVMSHAAYSELFPKQKARFHLTGVFQGQKIYCFPKKTGDLPKPKIHAGQRWVKYYTTSEEDALINNIVRSIVRMNWHPDCIVSVFDPDAPGGLVVGAKIALALSKQTKSAAQLSTIIIRGRESAGPRVITELPRLPSTTHDILVVDDVSFTGRTLETAYNSIRKKWPNARLRFATICVGEEMQKKIETRQTPISMEYPYEVVYGGSTVFTWDNVGPTGALRKEFDIQYPENLTFTVDCKVRPWGYMEIFALQKKAAVRILTILPQRRLSHQRHRFRDEYFVALDRGLSIEIDRKKASFVQRGDYIMIPRGTWHRFSNLTDMPIRSLEVAFGDYDENDIERLEDDYGRSEL